MASAITRARVRSSGAVVRAFVELRRWRSCPRLFAVEPGQVQVETRKKGI